MTALILKPQPGPQTQFLSSPADIVIFGGSAGGGKTYALLLEALRHHSNPTAIVKIFRKTIADIMEDGSIWTESLNLFPRFNARSVSSPKPKWTFPDPNILKKPKLRKRELYRPTGCTISFAGIQHEKDKIKFQGAQLPVELWDELTHIEKSKFWYLYSRNRLGSGEGIVPYVRGTCNPDPDHWLAEFIAWWIDQETGLAIPERSGIIRYMIRDGNSLVWSDCREDLAKEYPHKKAISVTFIPSKLDDNQLLLKKDPGYFDRLQALPYVERVRLLGGNWKIRSSAGNVFKSHWFKILPQLPSPIISICRYWDQAATLPNEKNPDPDWTVGVLMARLRNGMYVVLDVIRFRGSSGQVESLIVNTAKADTMRYRGLSVIVGLEVEPGSAGKYVQYSFTLNLAGFNVKFYSNKENKETRAAPLAVVAENANIYLIEADWNKEYIREMEGFPDAPHDDQVDGSSGAFREVSANAGAITQAMSSDDQTYNDFFADD